MSKSDEQWEFLRDVAKLIMFADYNGIKLTGGELDRTEEQQRLHFNSGRSKTMKSLHLDRLAIDFNFFIDGDLIYFHPKLDLLGKFWEGLSPKNRWGGNFDKDWTKKDTWHDTPHFERQA